MLYGKRRVLPYTGCTANTILQAASYREDDYKNKKICFCLGISSYKLKQIFKLLDEGQPADPILTVKTRW
jgi:hypothetical protein